MNDDRLSFNGRRFLDVSPRWASEHAEKIAGMSFSPDERRALLDRVNGDRGYMARI